jgi:hypothetical protein
VATLTQLYTRLILDTNRDDMGSGGELEQAKIDAVADAIELHADEPFWFNRASGSVSTVAATATVALPAGIRVARKITRLGEALSKVPLEAIAGRTETGAPSRWAENDGAIQLWPIPDAVYSLSLFGTADLGVPATSNEWTSEGYRLILAEAKIILCRGSLRDPDGLALAKDARDEALAKLRRETMRRCGAAFRTDLPGASSSFSITRG